MLKLDSNLIFTILNLLILYGLMRKFLYKPVMTIMAERQTRIRRQMEEAKERRTEAEKLQAHYEASLQTIDQQAETMMQQTREKAQQMYDREIQKAQAETRKMRQQAREQIALEQKKAEAEVHNQIGELAMNAVYDILTKQRTAACPEEVHEKDDNGSGPA